MMSLRARFLRQMRAIQRLVWFQRGFRWALRSAWLTGLSFLVTWLLAHFFGWLPGLWLRVGLSFFVGLIPLCIGLLSRPEAGALAWRMDRRLGLQERISTAWEVARAKETANPLEKTLLDEASQSLPEIHLQVLRHGWGAGRDLLVLILVVVALSVMLVLTFPLPQLPQIPLPGSGNGVLPALGGEPSAEDVFPGDVPGMPEGGEPDPEVPGELTEIFSDIAGDLAGESAFQAISEALDAPDLEGSAEALEDLAENLDQLPEEARQTLAESFSEAVSQIEGAGYPDLAESFGNAADSLAGGLDSQAGDLENLAEALRGLGSEETPEPEPTPDQATPEPVERLGEDGQAFELEAESATESDLLVPADAPGEEQAEGEPPGGPSYADEDVIDTILVPYTYPWYWQDLISDYFTP